MRCWALGWALVGLGCSEVDERPTDQVEVADIDLADAEVTDVTDTTPGEVVVPIGCEIAAPTACPSPAPSYRTDVEPIVRARCVSCHYGQVGGPWPLNSYDHVSDWRDTIRSAMLDCSMPPPEDGLTMSERERVTILEWIRCGMPR